MGACCSSRSSKGQETKTTRFHNSKKSNPRKLNLSLGSEPTILIIGAGVSGLTCAVELKKYGFKFVRILEASHRIGGRIRTLNFADNTIDLGAQWVHGQKGNSVYEMVYNQNMLESSGNRFAKVDWIRSNGQRLPRPVADQLVGVVMGIFDNRNADLNIYEGTLGEYIEEKFLSELEKPDLKEIDRELALDFLRAFKKMEGAAAETGYDEMSGSGFQAYEPCPGDNMLNWREKGFRQFLYVLLKGDERNEKGILKDCIEFDTRVTRIDWDRMDGTVQVYCEKQKSFVVDHVVVTVSLGVLKKNPSLFDPRLPSDKRRAINFTGFGHLCKIFLEFDNPFWKDLWVGFNVVWTAEDYADMRRNIELAWLTDIYGFYCNELQPRVLQIWASGEYVEYMETLETSTVTQGVMSILRRFLPHKEISEPTRVMISKWTTDPAHLGSYSYPSMLTKSYNTGAEELSQPVNLLAYEPITSSLMTIGPMTVRPVLLFAGEATSTNHYSTVHGAVESGLREAHRLAGYYLKDL